MKKFLLFIAAVAIALTVSAQKVVMLYDVANYIDFQALYEADPTLVDNIPTSTNLVELPNGTVLRGFQRSDGTEAEIKWNVKTTYNTVVPTPEWEGVDSLRVGTAYRAASRTSIELGRLGITSDFTLVVFFSPNGDAERGVVVSVLGDTIGAVVKSGMKIDGIRPAYAAEFRVPAGFYEPGDVTITMANNTSNIFGIGIYPDEEVEHDVPSDAELANYYDQGDVCVCIHVPADMACNDIVLTGSFNGWKSSAADCVPFEPVAGYDGWYVASFTPESEPDAEKGIQAKPIMLDVDGQFNWDYQVGAATVIRGGVQVVSGAYAGEIDLINYGTDAPNVLTVDAWKQNPCTAIYHNYTITVVSDGCNGYVVPFLVGAMTQWAFQPMQLDVDKSVENQVPTYSISFKAAEGTPYQIVSGLLNESGEIEIEPAWMDEAYMQALIDGGWIRIPGEEGDNQLTHENANIVWDLRADNLRWARCDEDPIEYVIVAVKLPSENCPAEGVDIIGSFDEWAGTPMELLQTGWWFAQLKAKATQCFKFRSAGSWNQEIEIYNAEDDRWRLISDNQLIFGQLWSDDYWKGVECKWIEIDMSDPEMFRWTNSGSEPVINYVQIDGLYYALNTENNTANVVGVAKNTGEFVDWATLPQEYVFESKCPADAALLGLKNVKVYADDIYINILVEYDPEEIPDHELVPFHVFLNTDNSDATGGGGGWCFTDLNVNILLEGFLFLDEDGSGIGEPCQYDPGVYAYAGPAGSDEWDWEEVMTPAPFCKSRHIAGNKVEIQLMRELIPANWNTDEFGIGFDIQQNWSSVGVLPQATPTDENPYGKAHKLQVKIHHVTTPAPEAGDYTNIIIPAIVSYEGQEFAVVGIENSAFYNDKELVSIVVPESVYWVGYDAFYGCDNLLTYEGPACGLEAIHNNKLEAITIRSGYVDLYAITRNYPLRKLYMDGAENEVLYDYAFTSLSNLIDLVLPVRLQQIGYMAVAGCMNLQRVVIPGETAEIGKRAFEDCRSLAAVIFEGEGLRLIDDWAFYNCHELASINIPEGAVEIGKAAFYGCVHLQDAHIPASMQAIGDNAFALCSKLNMMEVEAVIPPTVEPKTFYEVSREAPVYVPDESVETYLAHPIWGELNIIGRSHMPQGLDQVNGQSSNRKLIIDGQILIQRGDKTYTVQGQEVK